MERKITFLVFTMLFCSTIFAQSFKFYSIERDENYEIIKETPLENGSTITIEKAHVENWGTDDAPSWNVMMESDLCVKNITGEELMTVGSQKVVERPVFGEFQFCYSLCQNTREDISQQIEIQGNSYLNTYHMAFKPAYEKYESAEVTYKVENKYNPSDEVSITVKYKYSEASTDITSTNINDQINVYQNGSMAEFTYNFDVNADRRLTICDVTGKTIESKIISDANGTLSCALDKGLYIYSLIENGTIVGTRKFAIR